MISSWLRQPVHAVLILLLGSIASAPGLLAEESSGNLGRQATRELQVLARIGNETITVDDFQAELARRAPEMPRLVSTAEGRQRILDEMVRHRALATRAKQAGYDRDPEVVEVFERMMVTKYSRDQLQSRLQAVDVSNEEVEDFYRQNVEKYTRPGRSRAAIIFLPVPSLATVEKREALRDRATGILSEARQLTSVHHFGDLARRHSDHRASRYQGGVIGWLTPRQENSRWPQVVRDALFALTQPGTLAPLVETEEGFYLIRLVELEEGGVLPFEQVADGIRHRLLRERKDGLRSAFYDELYAELAVSVDPARLESLPWPSTDVERAIPSPPALPAIRQSAVAEHQGADDE